MDATAGRHDRPAPTASPAVAIEEATTPAALEALRPEWTELWRRSRSATPFQSPAWLIPWWRHFGSGDPLTLAARREGRLVGLLPLFVQAAPDARKLLLIGSGISDYLDALVDTDGAGDLPAAMLRHLARRERCWDVCELQDLPPNSPLRAAPTPPGWSDESGTAEVCPVLALPDGIDALRRVVPPLKLRDLRRARRLAEKLGPVRFERADRGNLEELLDALFRLHGACWARRGEPGVLADPTVRAFHREAAAALLALGALRLHALRVGERIVASYYGFAGMGRAYAYLSGFDPGLQGQSLGTLVVGLAIEEAVQERVREFHFLRGGERYKYRWGAEDRWNGWRRLRGEP